MSNLTYFLILFAILTTFGNVNGEGICTYLNKNPGCTWVLNDTILMLKRRDVIPKKKH